MLYPLELLASLFRFLMRRMLPAKLTVLLHLQSIRRLLLIFRRRIVSVLAVGTGQCH